MQMDSIVQSASEMRPEQILSQALNAVRSIIRDLINDLNNNRLRRIGDKQKRLEEHAQKVAAICGAHLRTLERVPQDLRRLREKIQTSTAWDYWTLGLSRMRRRQLCNKEIFRLQALQRASKYSLHSNQVQITETYDEIAHLDRLSNACAVHKNASLSGWIAQVMLAISSALMSIALFMTNEFKDAIENAVHAVQDFRAIGARPPVVLAIAS